MDKPITEYVKSWPEKHPPITVRQIASHTSGIRHYKKNPDCDEMQSDDHDTKYPEFYSNIAYKNIEDALEVFKTDDLLCEPGEIVCWCFIHKIYYYYFILYTENLTW